MGLTFIHSVIKLFSFIIIVAGSVLNSFEVTELSVGINNDDKNKSSNVTNTVINYKTIITYNNKIPSGISNIKTPGEYGIAYLDPNGNTYKIIKDKQDEVVEIGTGKYGEYRGVVTAYGPDCDTCDGLGIVACTLPNKKAYNLITDGIYYEDNRYGKLQVLAADFREFPCGTIMEVANDTMNKPILGIVLDTGYSMRKAYDNGYVHIDVAYETEKNLLIDTNKNTNFSVKRWGW